MRHNVGNIRDVGSMFGLGRSPGEENGKPLQYSCLEKPMDRGAWRATVHRVTKSQTESTAHITVLNISHYKNQNHNEITYPKPPL